MIRQIKIHALFVFHRTCLACRPRPSQPPKSEIPPAAPAPPAPPHAHEASKWARLPFFGGCCALNTFASRFRCQLALWQAAPQIALICVGMRR